MRRRNVLFITLLSVMMAAGFAACRYGHHRGGFDEFDLEAAINRIASRLDLDASQKGELEVIVGEIAAKARELHADHETRHQELADLVRQETVSRDAVDRMIEAKLDKIAEMTDFAADRLIALHAILTPEQREQVAAHIEAHASNRCRFFRD